MKKIALSTCFCLVIAFQGYSQCTFETLFPLKWGASRFLINEHYQSNPIYKVGGDTITGSIFLHGLDYFFTARNMRLYFYSYTNVQPHPCFKTGSITLNAIANDSGLVAYNYQVTFPASQKEAYLQMVDSLRKMMDKKFVYHSSVENHTESMDTSGAKLTGHGVCVYYNDEPIISSNLTYPPFVIRAGYLAKQPQTSEENKVVMNQAEQIAYYRVEILYKVMRTSW